MIQNNNNQNKQVPNRMGTQKEGRLLFSMAWPMILSMLIQALYNVVDSIFVSRLGEDALTAVSLAFPIQMLMISVAVGTGIGMNSYMSRKLGAREFEDANYGAGVGLLLMALSSLAFTLFGIFGVRPFFAAFSDSETLRQMGGSYLSICSLFCIGVFVSIGCERIMQAQGKTVNSMLMQLVGAVVNIILDPIMIFGLWGCPAYGIAGAAYATVIGQWVSMLVALLLVFLGKHEIKISPRHFRLEKSVVRGIYQVGLPSIVLQSIGTVMNLAMNALLIGFTATAVAVFGVYFKVQSVVFMPLFGLTGAAMSILAYNFGARSRDRLMKTYRLTVGVALLFMLIGTAVFWIIPDRIMALFDATPGSELMRIGVSALHILSMTFPLAAFTISNSVLFQAVGQGFYSMMLSVVRQLVALIPAAFLISKLATDVNAIWWAFPIAEIVGLLLSLFYLKKLFQNQLAAEAFLAPLDPVVQPA